MSTVSTTEPRVRMALGSCVAALRRLAAYQLDSALDRRLQDLSEQKESLSPEAHEELMALVVFTQQRTIDKLEAQLALKRLSKILPDVVEAP